MATPRYYDIDGKEITPARPPLLAVILNYALYGTMLAVMAAGLFLMWPSLVARWTGQDTPSAQTELAPTLAPAARVQLQQAAPSTSQEGQALRQAVPTVNLATPPPLPLQATAQAVSPPSVLEDAPAQSLSPVDLVWVPVPTPTTMLSQEQYDASQASEEVNFINNAEAGLTEAQKLVTVHAAEQAAQP